MDPAILGPRFVHILAGVYWAGTMFFLTTLLEPSIRDAGPEGGRVMQALIRRRYLTVMPLMALLTILSGIDLLRRASGGYRIAWFSTPRGATLMLGSVAALVGFLIGVMILRPAALRVAALGQAITQAADPASRRPLEAEAEGLRRRLRTSARIVAVLLALSVAAMAVARYLS